MSSAPPRPSGMSASTLTVYEYSVPETIGHPGVRFKQASSMVGVGISIISPPRLAVTCGEAPEASTEEVKVVVISIGCPGVI